MSKPRLIDKYSIKYKGVTITIRERPSRSFLYFTDYGYKTSNGISGIGQKNPRQAEIDAMHAIDRKLADEAKSQ